LAVHHDVKPARHGVDTRRPAQLASGGAVFSITDAPVHVEAIDDTRTLIRPDAFKFAIAPPRFAVERTVDPTTGFVRVRAIPAPEGPLDSMSIMREKVIAYLRATGGRMSGSSIQRALGVNKPALLHVLSELQHNGVVNAVDGPRNAQMWGISESLDD
jgi:hypothetical protein